jgi:hypothetical protein
MAGDWIKMRGNLWDDPRIGALVDATDTSEAAVVGGLYWLWATADQHSEDGTMPGLTLRQIDRKTGIPGFAAALVSIGWIEDHADGITIVKFDEHNGASAKKRCQTAKRVANHAAANAQSKKNEQEANAESVSPALAREREEEEKEKSPSTSVDGARTTPGEACKAMRSQGMADTNPSSPTLIALLEAGITLDELTSAAKDAVEKKKPFAYALAAAEGRRRDAVVAPLPAARGAAEPSWRAEQRQRTQQAAPGVAAYKPADQFFLDVKATDVTPRRLG